MARAPRALSFALLFAAALLAVRISTPAFVPAPNQQVKAAPVAAAVAAGLSPLAAQAMDAQIDASSVDLALAPWESPTLGFIFTLASCTMSIALVVWGRNGL